MRADHITLGHRYDHSPGQARKAKPWKGSSNLQVPEKTFLAPAAEPFRGVSAAQTSSRPARGIPESALQLRQYKQAVKDPGLRETGRQFELLTSNDQILPSAPPCAPLLPAVGTAQKIPEPSLCICLWLVGAPS